MSTSNLTHLHPCSSQYLTHHPRAAPIVPPRVSVYGLTPYPHTPPSITTVHSRRLEMPSSSSRATASPHDGTYTQPSSLNTTISGSPPLFSQHHKSTPPSIRPLRYPLVITLNGLSSTSSPSTALTRLPSFDPHIHAQPTSRGQQRKTQPHDVTTGKRVYTRLISSS